MFYLCIEIYKGSELESQSPTRHLLDAILSIMGLVILVAGGSLKTTNYNYKNMKSSVDILKDCSDWPDRYMNTPNMQQATLITFKEGLQAMEEYAIQQSDYWKRRCISAEALIGQDKKLWLGYDDAYRNWQQIVNETPK